MSKSFALSATLGSAALLALLSCSGNSPTGSVITPPPPPASTSLTGQLRDDPIDGVSYSTSSGMSGVTSNGGQYAYRAGDVVTFRLGTLVLGVTPASGVVTPLELAAGSANKLQNLLVLFQSLDNDGNPDNGISISAATSGGVTTAMDLTALPATFASTANTALVNARTAGGLTTPIVTPTQAGNNFLSQFLTLTSLHIWVSLDAGGSAAFRSTADGGYVLGQAGTAGGGGQSGVEVGTVTTRGFDTAGYFFNPAVVLLDTNGQWGFSHPFACDRLRMVGDVLLAVDCSGVVTDSVHRADNDPTGIVGVWARGSATILNKEHLIFAANGRYFIVDPLGNFQPGGCGTAGVETGAYTYNASSKILKVSGLAFDTDGCSGFSASTAAGSAGLTFTLSADGMTATFLDAGSTATVYRVSN